MTGEILTQRPDYLAPGALIVFAFLALWRHDPRQRYALYIGLSFAVAVANAAFVPMVGGIESWSPGRVAYLGFGVVASLTLLVLGAAELGHWSVPRTVLSVLVAVVPPALGSLALVPVSPGVLADAGALWAGALAALVLWREPEAMLRLAAVLILARGVNLLELTRVLPGYTVVERVALNHVLGYTAGVVLLLGSFLRVMAELAAERDAQQRLVDRRTRDLVQRRATLLAANHDLQQLTQGVREALDTPLARLRAATDALAGGALAQRVDAVGRGHLARMANASQRMQQIVQSLLTLSQAASHALQREPLDLGALARECFAGLAARATGPVPAFEVEDGLQVRADRALVASVLENLLGNAWKYSAKTPGARIALARSPQAPNGFVVRDNGAGFDPADAGKLFVPFQRLHDAREFEGTGVGLATVQRIVARHGGRIWAEGEPGKGAAFHFTLGPD